MARNIAEVYLDNPLTTLASNDLIYIGASPFDTSDDAAIKFSDFLNQLSGQFLPLAGGTMTGTLGISGDPTSHIGIDWIGADEENIERVPNNQLQAWAIVDVAGNQYAHVNSSTNRPKYSLDQETQINTPFIDTNVLATGTIYNSAATLTASASGGSVTGVSTNFPTQCANGIIYWPSTQNYARIIARNSATSLTIDTSVSLSAAPFVIYYGGITYNPQTNIFALSAITSLVFGDGSSFTTNGNHPTTLTTTGTTNSTLPVGTTTLVPTTGTGASGTWAITAANVTTNANLTGGVTSVGNAATVVTNANLTGDVTSSGNATTYAGIVPLNKGGLNASNTAASGKIPRGNGTAFVSSTATFADTYAINSLLVASSADTITALAPANNAVYQSSATGVVSASTSQTYTPTIGDGTNNFTGGTASGWYYRVGARTFVNINISWTGKGSASAGNSIRISLPITAGATPNSNTFSIGFTNGITSTTQIMAFANSGDSFIQLINFVSGSSATGVLVSAMGASGQIQLSGWVGS